MKLKPYELFYLSHIQSPQYLDYLYSPDSFRSKIVRKALKKLKQTVTSSCSALRFPPSFALPRCGPPDIHHPFCCKACANMRAILLVLHFCCICMLPGKCNKRQTLHRATIVQRSEVHAYIYTLFC